MHGQSPAVHIVRLIAQEVEKLGITHSNQEIKAIVRIAHNEEQRRLLVAQRIQLQFVIRRQLTQFGDIEHRQPRAAGNQNAFRRFSRDKLSRTFLSFFKKQPCNKMLQGCFFEINIPLFMHL